MFLQRVFFFLGEEGRSRTHGSEEIGQKKMTNTAKRPRLCKQGKHDVVYTPDALARAIVGTLKPHGKVLEPCSGGGAFLRAFADASLTFESCEIEEGRDFMDYGGTCDWVITNPPFSRIAAFLEKAYSTGASDIAFLMSASAIWMNGKLTTMRRYGYYIKAIYEVESPYFRRLNEWPQSGFALSVVHLSRGSEPGLILHGVISW